LNPAIHKNTTSGQNEISNHSRFLFLFFFPLACPHWLILYTKQILIKTLPRDFEGEEKNFSEIKQNQTCT